MSGGVLTDYGSSSLSDMDDWAKMIEKDNPLLAEQMRDMCKLLGRYDCYLSGDIGEDDIEKAWSEYREKWIDIDTQAVEETMYEKCLDMVHSMVKGYTHHDEEW